MASPSNGASPQILTMDPINMSKKAFFPTQHMVGTLTALLKTVRSVEDEASRGARALESTVEAIKQAVIVSSLNFSTCSDILYLY